MSIVWEWSVNCVAEIVNRLFYPNCPASSRSWWVGISKFSGIYYFWVHTKLHYLHVRIVLRLKQWKFYQIPEMLLSLKEVWKVEVKILNCPNNVQRQGFSSAKFFPATSIFSTLLKTRYLFIHSWWISYLDWHHHICHSIQLAKI